MQASLRRRELCVRATKSTIGIGAYIIEADHRRRPIEADRGNMQSIDAARSGRSLLLLRGGRARFIIGWREIRRL